MTKFLTLSKKSSYLIWKEMRHKINITLKLLHVTRNPFDNLATSLLRSRYGYTLNWTEIYKSPVSINLIN